MPKLLNDEELTRLQSAVSHNFIKRVSPKAQEDIENLLYTIDTLKKKLNSKELEIKRLKEIPKITGSPVDVDRCSFNP